MKSKYRSTGNERANFHEALIAMEKLIFQAAGAVALWKCLHQTGRSLRQLNRETSFLDQAMSAAWTAAVVRCYGLQDTNKSALSLIKLLQLSAAKDSPTQPAFLSPACRQELKAKLKLAIEANEPIMLLRHNQQAHISSMLVEPDMWDVEPAARAGFDRYLTECLDILRTIEQHVSYPETTLPDFDNIIDADLKVLLTQYDKLPDYPVE